MTLVYSFLTGSDQMRRLDGEFNLVTADGVEKVWCAYVSSGLFSTLRVRPQLGRAFLPEEDQREGNRVAIIGYDYWQRRYTGDPNVIGRTLTVDTYGRRDYTIVGVMPVGFRFPNRTEIWLPVGRDGIPRDRRGGHWLSVIARLKDGATLEQAQAEMNTIQTRIEQQHREALIGSHVEVIPLLEQTLGRNLRWALLILWGVVACVLLIACANVANLLLARAADRQKEIAIRLALGGSRWRMIRQLLTESLLLAVIGGVIGVLLANWSLDLLIAFNADHVPRLSETRLDGWSLTFTLLITCLTGLIFGLAPAWQTTKPDLNVAKRYFPNENPIGKRIHPGRLNPGQVAKPDPYTNQSMWTEVVGVVADVKSLNLNPQVEANVFVPYWQWPMQSPTLIMRTVGNSANLAAGLYSEVKALNKNLPTPKVQP
jgi:putative ABC transport system permease protein